MSNQDSSTASLGAVEFQAPSQSFLSTPADLKRLLRQVSAQGKPAVEALVTLLESKDEKIRLTAATKLLELQIAVAKEINTDQLQRLISEVRLGKNSATPLLPGEKENRPLVDFTTIREVE